MSGAPPIAGDFLEVLARHGLAAPPATVAQAGLPQTEATTVFAFHFAEGVMMVGDRRATAGNVIVTDAVEKVVELDDTTMLAIAGVPAMAFEMARVLQTSFEYYRRSQLQPLSLPAKVRALARLLRENLPLTMQGVGVVMPLFVGLDTRLDPAEPRIHFYDPLGAQFHAVKFAASGSGAGTIRSVLSFQDHYGAPRPAAMSLEEAIRFALRLLTTAAEFDSATGGIQPEAESFATIKVLRSSGVETIDPGRQRAALPL
jgi:proteasome beta subunit